MWPYLFLPLHKSSASKIKPYFPLQPHPALLPPLHVRHHCSTSGAAQPSTSHPSPPQRRLSPSTSPQPLKGQSLQKALGILISTLKNTNGQTTI
ncbi:hypothetical protein Hanom_Chr05g00402121 [Helianthus anomalus]